MGIKLIPIFLVIFGLLGAGFFWYYNNTQKRISILTENNAKLTAVTETQKASNIEVGRYLLSTSDGSVVDVTDHFGGNNDLMGVGITKSDAIEAATYL